MRLSWTPVALLGRLSARIGIRSRLLVPSVIAIILSVAGAQWWTIRLIEERELALAQRSLQVNLELLRDQVQAAGSVFRVDGDRLLAGEVVLNGRNEVVDKVKAIAGGVATIFLGDTRVATNVQRPDGTRGVGTKLAPGAAYDSAITAGQVYRGRNEILGRMHLTIYEPIKDASGRQVGLLFVGIPLTEAAAAVATVSRQAVYAGLAAVLLFGTLRLALLVATLKPFARLGATLRRVVAGETAVAVAYCDRLDEVGDYARSIEQIRQQTLATRDAADRLEAERAVDAAERRRLRLAMAETFESRISGLVAAQAEAVDRMRNAAAEVARVEAENLRLAGEVSGASDRAAGSVQSVAAAAEQLSASISEISRQVVKSADVARVAAEDGARTNQTVDQLSAAAARIGDVVKLIGDIAGQTNLLALNATIEAARAGEAGKGFAVVASEVKSLAGQTAKATEEIAAQIAAMQAATGGVVEAIRGISSRIDEISGLASAISVSVDQQGSATSEIARSVQDAATGTSEVSQAIGRVANNAGSAAEGGEVLGHETDLLKSKTGALREAVGDYLRDLRAA